MFTFVWAVPLKRLKPLLTTFLSLNQEQVVAPPEPESAPTRAPETQPPAAVSPAPEEADLTWEDKEDKLDAENIQPESPKSPSTDKKYQYKEGGSLKLDTFQCHMLAVHCEQWSYLTYVHKSAMCQLAAFMFALLKMRGWSFSWLCLRWYECSVKNDTYVMVTHNVWTINDEKLWFLKCRWILGHNILIIII